MARVEYRNETGVVKRFLADECVVTNDQDDFVPRREVYAACVSWVTANIDRVFSAHTFAAKLRETGVVIGPEVAHVCDKNDRRVPLWYYRTIRFRYLDDTGAGSGPGW